MLSRPTGCSSDAPGGKKRKRCNRSTPHHLPLRNKTFRKLQTPAPGPTPTIRRRPRREQNGFTTSDQAQAPLCFHWNHWKPDHTTYTSIHYGSSYVRGSSFLHVNSDQ